MKTVIKIFCIICVLTNFLTIDKSYCQKNIFTFRKIPEKNIYGNYSELKVLNKNDSLNSQFIDGYNIIYYQARREWKTFESFEPEDTTRRDTLIIYNKKYTIDSLIDLENQYSGSYVLFEAFLTYNKEQKYIILLFYDGYQVGSAMQTIYIIFEIKGNEARHCSSYIANNYFPNSKVKLFKRKSGVFLKSKNINKVL